MACNKLWSSMQQLVLAASCNKVGCTNAACQELRMHELELPRTLHPDKGVPKLRAETSAPCLHQLRSFNSWISRFRRAPSRAAAQPVRAQTSTNPGSWTSCSCTKTEALATKDLHSGVKWSGDFPTWNIAMFSAFWIQPPTRPR